MNPTVRGIALVTGSATGVGRACALRFAAEGYDLVVNYPEVDRGEAEHTAERVRACGRRCLLVQCDVSRNEEVVQMIDQIGVEFARLDIVVNNAGATYFVDPQNLAEMTEDKWDRILAVNTKGPFFVMRAAAPWLKKSPAGAVVNVSSVAGVSGVGSSIAYSASKGALNTMTKTFARLLAPEVRVNAVCPGPIDSRWLRQNMTEDQLQARVANFPIPRLSQPEDIADAVFYLAAGTRMSTGQLLIVDGGRTI